MPLLLHQLLRPAEHAVGDLTRGLAVRAGEAHQYMGLQSLPKQSWPQAPPDRPASNEGASSSGASTHPSDHLCVHCSSLVLLKKTLGAWIAQGNTMMAGTRMMAGARVMAGTRVTAGAQMMATSATGTMDRRSGAREATPTTITAECPFEHGIRM